MTNPFRSASDRQLTIEPCVVIIFGASGDLTHRKLVPALYNLGVDGLLPAQFSMVGVARREFSHESFREDLKKSVSEFSRRKPLNESVWNDFAENSYYLAAPFDQIDGYHQLGQLLDQIDQKAGTACNRVFYLATSPEYFETIGRNLAAAGLLDQSKKAGSDARARSARVVVEKPFGHDLQSARELNAHLLECMNEDQIYRIDHYLGKETVQNLLVFRVANVIFEPIWSHKYIDHVAFSVCDYVDVGSRAG